MEITTVKELEAIKTPHSVEAKKLYHTENAQVIHLALAPGEALLRHITPVDVFFYVLEGEGIVEVGEEKCTVVKDQLIESPAKIPHCWYNESDKMLRILVVKVPSPKEETKLL